MSGRVCKLCVTAAMLFCLPDPIAAEQPRANILRPDNLVAWCIVPFDAARRGPEARAEMLRDLGLRRCAYDWRAEHLPTFEREIVAYKQHGIEFFAFWSVNETAFQLLEKHELHPQVWVTLHEPRADANGFANPEEKVAAAALQLTAVAKRTAKMGSPLGLYNHGGWGGEPENLVAVCRALHSAGHKHVGIVYNFHHAHPRISTWPEDLQLMLPHLLCVNINGMNDRAAPKILPVGDGAHEREMLRVLLQSEYDGPVGILDHRSELDAQIALEKNLQGVARLREQLQPATPNP